MTERWFYNESDATIRDENALMVADVFSRSTSRDRAQDGHLLAAAPEMLEALELASTHVGGSGGTLFKVYNTIRAAIATAKGSADA